MAIVGPSRPVSTSIVQSLVRDRNRGFGIVSDVSRRVRTMVVPLAEKPVMPPVPKSPSPGESSNWRSTFLLGTSQTITSDFGGGGSESSFPEDRPDLGKLKRLMATSRPSALMKSV